MFNPEIAEILSYKQWRTKGFQFEIIIHVLVNSFWFIWIPMQMVYGHYKYFHGAERGDRL